MGFFAASEEEGGASRSASSHGSPILGAVTAAEEGDEFIGGDKGA